MKKTNYKLYDNKGNYITMRTTYDIESAIEVFESSGYKIVIIEDIEEVDELKKD